MTCTENRKQNNTRQHLILTKKKKFDISFGKLLKK